MPESTHTEDSIEVGEVGREVEGGVDGHEDPVESDRQPIDHMCDPIPFAAAEGWSAEREHKAGGDALGVEEQAEVDKHGDERSHENAE